ncbi:MAG: D-alanyl-D-alanine carboxypeptidase family protein [Parcubacteria group bacterium]|nr:D-alanyl-D-alanine carboxypeptidase family protein [Parcubacteria group bacterium]
MAIVLVFSMFFLTNTVANELRGSSDAIERQNKQADLENLSRLTEKQLGTFKKSGLLVPLPISKGVIVDDRLPKKYRYCRPWVLQFLVDLGENYETRFGKQIQVNSAVRTVEYQEELQKRNRNAASAKAGSQQSSHLTGATIDIAKKDMSYRELAWMRNHLIVLERKGLIEATEEFHQEVFHIMVFNRYLR